MSIQIKFLVKIRLCYAQAIRLSIKVLHAFLKGEVRQKDWEQDVMRILYI